MESGVSPLAGESDVFPEDDDKVEDASGILNLGENIETEIAIIIEQEDAESDEVDGESTGHEIRAGDMAITRKQKRPNEDSLSVAMGNSSDSNLEAHKKKGAKTEEEKGPWNCSNDICNDEDDEFMFNCKSCAGMYHYRCTDLPLYEIARYLGPGRRVYECALCVKVPEKLKSYRMSAFEPKTACEGSLKTNNEESGKTECIISDLKKDITALEKDIIDKDFLIRSQKEIIDKIHNRAQASIKESTENKDEILALKEERDELVALVKLKDKELGESSMNIESLKEKLEGKDADECSKDLARDEATQKLAKLTESNHDLTQRLTEKVILVSKMESLVESKQDLVDAKNETIDNLKVIINTLKGENENVRNKISNLTSNVIPDGQNSEVETPEAKNGVKESCEFIQIHGINGAIMNPFLLWADIQRKMNPENVWKESALKKFVGTEITEAKETLWRVTGEEHLGKMIRRQGPNRSSSEITDICGALKKLVENDKLPLFICTSGMVASTPIYTGDSPGINPGELNEHLNKIDHSIRQAVSTITETMDEKLVKNDTPVNSTNPPTVEVNTDLGGTIPISDTVAQQSVEPDSEWDYVPMRRQRVGKERPLPSNLTYLVVSNVKLGVRGLQIVQYLENKDIRVNDWDLLTTRDNATFLTYRITISKADAEKLKDSSLWPANTQIRPFKLSKKQLGKGTSGRKPDNRSKNQNQHINENFNQQNIVQNTGRTRDNSLADHNNPGYVCPTVPTIYSNFEIPSTRNNQELGTYAAAVNSTNPFNGIQQHNSSYRSYIPDHALNNSVAPNAQMATSNTDTYCNLPARNYVPSTLMKNSVAQSALMGNFNTFQASPGTSWYGERFANNERGILNGQTNSSRTSIPSNVKWGSNWSEGCDLPRVRFVDRIGTDQFIQQ